MNASFEDVVVLDEILNQNLGDWELIFKAYTKARKLDADAIGELAIENYYEMRDHVSNPLFKQKRKIEMDLEKNFPIQYFSKYSMVTFNEEIGYDEAMKKGRAQDKALLNLIADHTISTSLNMTTDELEIVLKKVQEQTNEILNEDKIAGL
jgi:kynurenine 3-monooxygenase